MWASGARKSAVAAGALVRHTREQWGITGSTEQRVRVAENRVRVPDLVVLTAGAQPDVLVDPPLLVIEILSPTIPIPTLKTARRTTAVWAWKRFGSSIRRLARADVLWCEWVESSRLEVKGTPLYVNLPEIFSQLTSA